MSSTPFTYFSLPGTGAVMQDLLDHWFSPTVTYNFAGNSAIEKQVVEDVASYGRQIGWLNEIVLALVDQTGFPAETLARMRATIARIEEIKKFRGTSAMEDAKDALDHLKSDAPDYYDRLIRQLIEERSQAGWGMH
ncbi:MAG: hypothetical protein JF619_20640 [Massilia sp.]|nr:hypothetical protein [Massilia sp.]